MINEVAALLIFALWLIDGRRINLLLAIFIYYLLIMSISGLSVYAYYIAACLVDLSIIAFISFLSYKYRQQITLNMTYCVIILFSMSLSGLTLIDQTARTGALASIHSAFNNYIIYGDLLIALLGCRYVQRWLVNRFLLSGGS